LRPGGIGRCSKSIPDCGAFLRLTGWISVAIDVGFKQKGDAGRSGSGGV